MNTVPWLSPILVVCESERFSMRLHDVGNAHPILP
jgi:hypothetical protein